MDDLFPSERLIRQYLLGRVSDEERSELELRLMTDNAFYNELLAVEDELIDDFLTGDLTADELEVFDSYFLASPERLDKVRFARVFKKYVQEHADSVAEDAVGDPPSDPADPHAFSEPAPLSAAARQRSEQVSPQEIVPPSFAARMLQSPYLRAAAVLLLVSGAAFGVWRGFFYESDFDRGITDLPKLFDKARPIQARITAFKTYVRMPVLRGGEATNPDDLAHRRIKLLLDTGSKNAASDNAHGELYLAEKQYAEAIPLLKSAVDSDPKNAQYHNDLGAGLLEEGKFLKGGGKLKPDSGAAPQEPRDAATDLSRSVDEFQQALRLNPSLLEAQFNLALAYEEIDSPQAEQAWQDYIAKDPNSDWTGEAKDHLKHIREQTEHSSRYSAPDSL